MFNFDWLNGVSLVVARMFLMLAFIIAFIFSLFVTKRYIYEGAKDQGKWRDFRIWIFILVIVQLVLYSYF